MQLRGEKAEISDQSDTSRRRRPLTAITRRKGGDLGSIGYFAPTLMVEALARDRFDFF